ncbi:MAG: transglycosylase domain-containing protein [Candidatus Spyradenecus sp.]
MTRRLPRLRRLGARLLALACGGALLFALAWVLAPRFVEDPLPALEARAPARWVYDRNGKVLAAFRGEDYAWRFPVPLSAISPEVLRATLIAEDANFYHHRGVDYGAALRALWQNVTSLRIVSGASTLSMQVAGLAAGRRRSLWGKFLQAARARKLEQLHAKDEILSAYLNHAPYGGQYIGIEAAAQAYFNTSAATLTFGEATLLCGLPQRPNALRPDRHPQAARDRQHRLLAMMVRRGALTQAQADEAYASAILRFRDPASRPRFERLSQPDENRHALLAGYPIDGDLQADALALLRRHLAHLPGVTDGACVILRAGSPDPVVYLGTLHFASPAAGQVDAAIARRQAGSTLKPFFFAEAIEGGLLAPATRLLDAPLRYGTYAPANYDGTFLGPVSAAEALARSLNTPVIRLLAELGEARCLRLLAALDLAPAEQSGLALALGTGGVTLLSLTRAYHALPAHFSPETAELIAHMLRRPLPGSSLDIAWKTGTANNNTDAWCVGWTPDWTVGVWFGNKRGGRAEALVGLEAAAPAVGELFTRLYQNAPPPRWPNTCPLAPLCPDSGLTPGPGCPTSRPETTLGTIHPRIPLRRCNLPHAPDTDTTPPPERCQILSPQPGTYRLGRDALPLQAQPAGGTWLCDGRPLPPGTPSVRLAPGLHTLHYTTPSASATTRLQILP